MAEPPEPAGWANWQGPGTAAPLPDDLGTRFLVFVDTEEEFDWSAPFRREASVAAMAALPAMHRRLAAAGVVPTYLATDPIVTDRDAAEMLAGFVAAGEAEVGAQLHPWVTPPFDEELTPTNSFAGNLPPALEAAKLARLTDRIAAAIGRRPTVYRAGRYGIGPSTARLLVEAGYRLDVSIRTGFDYSAEHGPDFSRARIDPYWTGPDGSLLALPLGAAWTGIAPWLGRGLRGPTTRIPRLAGLLARAHIANHVPLTPEGTSLAEAERAIDALYDRGVRLLSFSFHSPSLVPGCTPYVRDAADLAAFHRWWDGVLTLLDRRGVRPIGADALVTEAWRARDRLTG